MIEPLHRNVVVRRYQLPERTPGGLLTPEAYRGDRTQTLWEVEAAGPCAASPCEACREELERDLERPWHGLGMELRRNDILRVTAWTAIELPRSVSEDLWMLDATAILAVYVWNPQKEEE